MDEHPISAGTVAGLGIAAIVNIALPFALWIVWRKSSRASWLPLLAGVIGYLAAGLLTGVLGSAISIRKYLKDEGRSAFE